MNDNLPQFLKNKLNIKLLVYHSISDVIISDHKPVKAEFEVSIEENEDDYFNRLNEYDRLAYNDKKKLSSASIDSMNLYSCNIF